MKLVYATETGTARAFAEKLWFRLKRAVNGENLDVVDVAELGSEWMEASVVVFIVSTTGEGEVPLAMKPFWNSLLKSSLERDFASGLKFAVFGLGDSNYERFNAAARKLRARLVQLGGEEICKSGAGDDQTDSEMLFDRWTEDVLVPSLGLTLPANVELDAAKYTVAFEEPSQAATVPGSSRFAVLANRRLTSPTWHQDVRHLELDTNGVEYHTGDVFHLFPVVPTSLALSVLTSKFPQVDPHSAVKYSPPHPLLPPKTSVLHCLTRFLDLTAMPSRLFLLQLSFFAQDEEERDRLREFADSSPASASHYLVYCKRERRTIAEVLLDFPSLDLPFARLIEFMPRLKPRAFSIASSPQVAGAGVLHLTVALLQYLTPNKRMKHGTCSQYIASLEPGTDVYGYVTRGALSLPEKATTPLVMVATGTGCAPMRSLVQGDLGNYRECTRLYLGHRSAANDVLYRDWNSPSVKVCMALSKDNNVRVQQLLARDGEILYSLLVEQRGYLFVSGSAKQMPADVRETLVQQFMKHGRLTNRDDAVKLVRTMEKERRYVVDAWS
ncbi:hypothetical protein BASA81_005834 [Batrachochytrium salamandrivorans]|nr:hypothetical protein BASA81_005834 [Batrachochytrium salamandrivorans]